MPRRISPRLRAQLYCITPPECKHISAPTATARPPLPQAFVCDAGHRSKHGPSRGKPGQHTSRRISIKAVQSESKVPITDFALFWLPVGRPAPLPLFLFFCREELSQIEEAKIGVWIVRTALDSRKLSTCSTSTFCALLCNSSPHPELAYTVFHLDSSMTRPPYPSHYRLSSALYDSEPLASALHAVCRTSIVSSAQPRSLPS